MADNPITVQLPQDLPTDWTAGQTVAPNGADVGLTKQYGYNYLGEQVNAAQKAAEEVGKAFSGLVSEGQIGKPDGVASLDGTGKVPNNQLPEMNYDPAGSATAVQGNLNAHTANRNNPHGVTASQTGALPLNGGTMTGHINMTGYAVYNLPPPLNENDAARKQDVDAVKQIAAIAMPVGGFIWFAAAFAPPGFLVCDGSVVNRTTYSALFSVIGTAFGGGDGSSTFALPNLINRFIKGDKSVGVYHSGTYICSKMAPGSIFSIGEVRDAISTATGSSRIIGESSTTSGSMQLNYIQPPNVTMLPCIKY